MSGQDNESRAAKENKIELSQIGDSDAESKMLKPDVTENDPCIHTIEHTIAANETIENPLADPLDEQQISMKRDGFAVFKAFVLECRVELLVIFLISFLLATILNILTIKVSPANLAFINQVNLSGTLLWVVIFSLFFIVARMVFLDRAHLFIVLYEVSAFFGILAIIKNPPNLYFVMGIITIVGFMTYVVFNGYDNSKNRISFTLKPAVMMLVLLSISMILMIAWFTILRHRVYWSSTFDFGIFTQMYEYMKSTGLPFTTVERNRMLSHFAVHFSPIYYLLLPGYLIFDSPEYLLVMQSVLIFSASIPLFLLCRHYRLSNAVSLMLSIVYLAYPGVVNGAFFDFHENKFITVLLLWMFFFYEKHKCVPMYVLMVLVLFVKEDAALYVIFFGVFALLSSEMKLHGLIVLMSGIIYFIVITTLMKIYGIGIMESRFDLYMLPGETGLSTVLKNVIANPMFLLKNMFTEKKFIFLLYMFTPMLFIPFASRKLINLVLLVPLVVMNLMTAYPYQSMIGYQYTYGVSALLFFLFVMNLSHFHPNWQRIIAVTAVFASVSLMMTTIGVDFKNYLDVYSYSKVMTVATDKVLATVPYNETVTAENALIPHIPKIKILYLYPSEVITEYMIFDTRSISLVDEQKKLVEEEGYRLDSSGGYALIYKKHR